MKIVDRKTLREKDKERLIKAFKSLAAIGTTGKGQMNRYPLIDSNLESILDELQDISVAMGVNNE